MVLSTSHTQSKFRIDTVDNCHTVTCSMNWKDPGSAMNEFPVVSPGNTFNLLFYYGACLTHVLFVIENNNDSLVETSLFSLGRFHRL